MATNLRRRAMPWGSKRDEEDDVDNEAPDPLSVRLLTLLSAVYRVDAGAWARKHIEWLAEWILETCYGGIPGKEFIESAWDLQA